MLKNLSVLLLISALMAILAGCATLNTSQALPVPDDEQGASNTPADTTLEMYYWSDEDEETK